jgi:hypothetical protein
MYFQGKYLRRAYWLRQIICFTVIISPGHHWSIYISVALTFRLCKVQILSVDSQALPWRRPHLTCPSSSHFLNKNFVSARLSPTFTQNVLWYLFCHLRFTHLWRPSLSCPSWNFFFELQKHLTSVSNTNLFGS